MHVNFTPFSCRLPFFLLLITAYLNNFHTKTSTNLQFSPFIESVFSECILNFKENNPKDFLLTTSTILISILGLAPSRF